MRQSNCTNMATGSGKYLSDCGAEASVACAPAHLGQVFSTGKLHWAMNSPS